MEIELIHPYDLYDMVARNEIKGEVGYITCKMRALYPDDITDPTAIHKDLILEANDGKLYCSTTRVSPSPDCSMK